MNQYTVSVIFERLTVIGTVIAATEEQAEILAAELLREAGLDIKAAQEIVIEDEGGVI